MNEHSTAPTDAAPTLAAELRGTVLLFALLVLVVAVVIVVAGLAGRG
jgi:hypothetical protein